ncbi:YkuS family protein [Halanaerobaculum tunisiense]
MIFPKTTIETKSAKIIQEFQGIGHKMVTSDRNILQNVGAIIVSGEDNNLMNMSDIKTKYPTY